MLKKLFEDRLIHYCARRTLDENMSKQVEAILSQDLDWGYIIKKAKGEKVVQLLYHNLSEMEDGKGGVPKDILEDLKKVYHRTAIRNMMLCQKLTELLVCFREAGIKVILLKGMALIGTVYPNIALRPMVDVDLLVHKEDLPRIKEVLGKIGYKVNRPDYQMVLETFGSELGFEGEVSLEIRGDLAQYERFKGVVQIDNDALWETAKKSKIAGVDALVLSPEYLIFNLCIHLSLVHSFQRLIWFCDLREVLKFYEKEIDWKYIVEKATRFKIKTILYYCFYFSHKLLDAPVPLEIFKELEPSKTRKRFLALFRSQDCQLRGNRYIEQLLLMDRTFDILKVLLKILFPSSEWLRYRYSVRLPQKIYLYKLIHPFRLVFSSRFHR